MRLLLLMLVLVVWSASNASAQTTMGKEIQDNRFRVGALLFEDDFRSGTKHWKSELEGGGVVEATQGHLTIDVPKGASVWLTTPLEGPVLIEYEATVIQKGGPNDRVSDLNCFWMASDSRNSNDFFAVKRSGAFADYDQLKTYYVGLGGNSNTTTRFRRYIGEKDNRPLLPEHDLKSAENLIVANQPQTIRLVAKGSLIEFRRDKKRLFDFNDAAPYTSGYFGFRTVTNHMEIRHFRVFRLL